MFRAIGEFVEIEPHIWQHRFRLHSMAVWRQSCSLVCLFDGAAATNLVELAETLDSLASDPTGFGLDKVWSECSSLSREA